MTKHLLYFAIFFFMGALLFRYCLSVTLENRLFNLAWIAGGFYFIFNFLIGWFFGKKEYESLPIHDVGFRFHGVTYLLYHGVAVLWFAFGFHSQFESMNQVYNVALFWGIGLVVHFVCYLFARKKSIKGLSKEDLFE